MAQDNPLADSLKNVIAKGKDDTTQVLNLITLGQQVEGNDPELAKQYYTRALALSNQLNYDKGKMKYFFNYTAVLNMQGKYDSALMLNKQSLQTAEKFNDNYFIGAAENNTGTSYWYLGDNEEAIKHLLKAVARFEAAKDSFNLQFVYDMMGVVQSEIGLHEQALGNHLKAVAFAGPNATVLNKSAPLLNAAVALNRLKRYDTARVLLNEVLSMGVQENNTYLQSQAWTNLGDGYLRQKNFTALQTSARNALALAIEIGDPLAQANAHQQLSLAKFYQGQADSAGIFAGIALAELRSLGNIQKRADLYRLLSDVALLQNNVRVADAYRDSSEQILETLQQEQVRKNIQLAERKYETSKKEQAIQLQEAQLKAAKWQRALLWAGLIASAFIIFLLVYSLNQRSRRYQFQLAELEKEKKLLATQQLLRGQEEERNRFAQDLHDGLGGMLSGVKLQLGAMKGNLILSEDQARSFNSALGKLDESITEMRRVAHNMMPEALLKFGLNQALTDYCEGMQESTGIAFNYEFHGLTERLDSSVEIIVYRIVQELVNNAVKHAQASEIFVQVMNIERHLTITIEDNGKGFDPTNVKGGSGLKNIQSRVEYLKGKLDLRQRPGGGTSFHMECEV
jgi:signal transduction histidine kinase